jgi:hypothetical protein
VGSWHLEVKLGENPEKVLSRYKLVLVGKLRGLR